MKTDSYLNLCIEQAHLSPLHYRHGCIVVKGGKVIGQGFNDHRPGYDGGSVLKTGALPKTAFPLDDCVRSNSKFKPVEALSDNCGGGGHHANARLSMHSEMMAINSALTSSSTLAASTVSHVKPCFKLSGDSKRKRELRRGNLAAYVRSVCRQAAGAEAPRHEQRAGKTQAGKCRFEPSASKCDDLLSDVQAQRFSPTSRISSLPERRGEAESRGEEMAQEWVSAQEVQVI